MNKKFLALSMLMFASGQINSSQMSVNGMSQAPFNQIKTVSLTSRPTVSQNLAYAGKSLASGAKTVGKSLSTGARELYNDPSGSINRAGRAAYNAPGRVVEGLGLGSQDFISGTQGSIRSGVARAGDSLQNLRQSKTAQQRTILNEDGSRRVLRGMSKDQLQEFDTTGSFYNNDNVITGNDYDSFSNQAGRAYQSAKGRATELYNKVRGRKQADRTPESGVINITELAIQTPESGVSNSTKLAIMPGEELRDLSNNLTRQQMLEIRKNNRASVEAGRALRKQDEVIKQKSSSTEENLALEQNPQKQADLIPNEMNQVALIPGQTARSLDVDLNYLDYNRMQVNDSYGL